MLAVLFLALVAAGQAGSQSYTCLSPASCWKGPPAVCGGALSWDGLRGRLVKEGHSRPPGSWRRHMKRVRGQGHIFFLPGRGESKGGRGGRKEDRLSLCRAWGRGGRSREGESLDRGFFSLGFIKWNLKGNIEPKGGFLITSL